MRALQPLDEEGSVCTVEPQREPPADPVPLQPPALVLVPPVLAPPPLGATQALAEGLGGCSLTAVLQRGEVQGIDTADDDKVSSLPCRLAGDRGRLVGAEDAAMPVIADPM